MLVQLPESRIARPRKRRRVQLAPAFVQDNEIGVAFNVPTQAISYSSNVTAGDLLVYFHYPNNNSSTISIADTIGNSWTQAGSTATTGINVFTAWYAISIASGANTVTGTFSANDAFGNIVIAEYSGVSHTSPFDAYAGNFYAAGSTNPISSGNLTTTAAGDLLVAYFFDQGQGLVTGTAYGINVRTTWQAATIGEGDGIAASIGAHAAQATASLTGTVQLATCVAFKAATNPRFAQLP
jgi:hypothetical protein